MIDLPGHPVFHHFRGYRGPLPQGVQCGWLGDMYRAEWLGVPSTPLMEQYEATAPLPNHEEYFEWIGLLDAVATARRRFVMMEFGAGFGRWGVRGALAARQVGLAPSEIAVTFVEAEPDHVQWLRDTIAMNRGLDGVKTNLVDAAVTGADGEVLFATGHSKEWYGQEITLSLIHI